MTARELTDIVIELIEEMNNNMQGHGKIAWTDKAKELVAQIAEQARKTQIYEDLTDMRREFAESAKEDSLTLYRYMLNRIVNAPTVFHRNASIILLIPIIDDRIREGGESNGNG